MDNEAKINENNEKHCSDTCRVILIFRSSYAKLSVKLLNILNINVNIILKGSVFQSHGKTVAVASIAIYICMAKLFSLTFF